ncbi:hypothetical protein JNL27_12905 [bacterium]|nr:hypothetical protein [bacterium]
MGYSGIDINFSWSLWILLFLCIAAVAFSFWSYKETIPPASPIKKNLLASLRSLSIILVLIILFEPILNLTVQKEERPVVAVLIDQSESMGIVDKIMDRQAAARSVIKNEALQKLSDQYDIEYFTFSDDLKSTSIIELDTLTFNGSETDITSSLESLKKKMLGRNFAAVVLMTDGQYNLGVNPATYASAYGYPVYTIGIGDPMESKDVSITQVVHNDIVYLNNKIPVDVSLAAFGYKGKPLSVQLMSENKVIQTKYITIPDDGIALKAAFDFQADKAGLQKFTVNVAAQQDELTVKNNSKSFFIKVLKSRVNVCLVSGSPGPEHSFLYKTLTENRDIHVKALVEKKDGAFIDIIEPNSEAMTGDYDGYIFNDYPTPNSNPGQFQAYVSSILQDSKPFLLFNGIQLDINKVQQLKDVLPVELKLDMTLDESLVYPMLTVTGKNSAVMKVSDNPAEAVQQWMELPPMWISKVGVTASEGSDVLVKLDMTRAGNVIKSRRDIPLIISKKANKNKSIVVVPYGFWKSYFIMSGLGRNNIAYQSFIANAVRWLTTQDDTKPVIISTSKNIYRNGEKIIFSGQVYDEQFSPVNDANLKVQIKTPNRIYDVNMELTGNGRYEGSVNGLETGDYDFEGEAIRQDVSLGRDRGKFAVENFSIELLHTNMNEKLLKTVAAESGGQFFTPADFHTIANIPPFQPLITEQRKEIELWNKIILLFILAGLLSTEWFIRKRADML